MQASVCYVVTMHIDVVPNRKSPPAVLLRESYREGGKVKKRTLANLSSLSMEQVNALRLILKGEKLIKPTEAFQIHSSKHHGHVQAVRIALKRLGFEKLLASSRSRNRDIIVALVISRILSPDSKLATTRWWHSTTLPELCGVADADENELYKAMDWLLGRQEQIEEKLAKRHLSDGGMALYDLSSTYFEGSNCSLATMGYSRDKKKGKLQVNFGLVADPRGCPVSIRVYKGSTGDSTTLLDTVHRIQDELGVEHIVIVGDRGMITGKQVDELKQTDGVDWITALRTEGIRKLLKGGELQLGLFDERNLFELMSPDFPDERLVACRNEALAKRRHHKRQALLQATVDELEKIQRMVQAGRLKGKSEGEIGVRVGKTMNKYKVAKHFDLSISDGEFSFSINADRVAAEAALDGVYVVRTSLAAEQMSAEDAVRSYKLLCQVERAFRSFKTMDLHIRPIYHRLDNRVRSHIFLCMLAYYVQWHMQEAWRSLLFFDEDLDAKSTRDPVAPAQRSDAADDKASTKCLEDGSPAHSFQSLLQEMSTIVRNTCTSPGANAGDTTFDVDTSPNATQSQALELLKTITV